MREIKIQSRIEASERKKEEKSKSVRTEPDRKRRKTKQSKNIMKAQDRLRFSSIQPSHPVPYPSMKRICCWSSSFPSFLIILHHDQIHITSFSPSLEGCRCWGGGKRLEICAKSSCHKHHDERRQLVLWPVSCQLLLLGRDARWEGGKDTGSVAIL